MSAGGTSLRTLSEERRPSGRGKGGKGLGRGGAVVHQINFNDHNEKFIRDELYSRRHILSDDVDACLLKMRTELGLDSRSYYQAVSLLMRRLCDDPEWLRK